MDPEPIFEKSIEIKPIGFTLSFRARPSTVRRTVVSLLPWALYAALPHGRVSKVALLAARRLSPMVKQKIR
ncbi:MAG: hypothetical protein WD359_10805 [Dehalococcoidia bacterium]